MRERGRSHGCVSFFMRAFAVVVGEHRLDLTTATMTEATLRRPLNFFEFFPCHKPGATDRTEGGAGPG
jgi:hypothetical protein